MKDSAPHVHEDEIIRLFRAVLRAGMSVGCEIRPLFAEHGLTPPQWDVLVALAGAEPGGMMLSEIGQQLLVTGGNVTGLVDRLEEAGLARRTPHPQDRRVILAELTDRGRATFQAVFPEYRSRLHRLLAGWGGERGRTLRQGLERLTEEVAAKKASTV
jgi:DNA-binding MarR family transcriptional regulator